MEAHPMMETQAWTLYFQIRTVRYSSFGHQAWTPSSHIFHNSLCSALLPALKFPPLEAESPEPHPQLPTGYRRQV
jgi:hypothetical protein